MLLFFFNSFTDVHECVNFCADVLCAVNGKDIQGIHPEHLDKFLLGEEDSWVSVSF